MKTQSLKKAIAPIILTLALSSSMTAQVKLTSSNIFHIGYNTYTPLVFGSEPVNGLDNGAWSIEYDSGNKGLNFWKPWPTEYHGNNKLFIRDDGKVGIGRLPSFKLDVEGDIATYGTLRISSDARLKTNIQSLSGCMDKLSKLSAKSYVKNLPKSENERKATETNPLKREPEAQPLNTSIEMGFLAQDLEIIFPELVKKDNSGYLTVDYIGLIPVLVEALKEQKSQLDNLSASLNNCCKQKAGDLINKNNPESGETSSLLYQNNPNPFNESTQINFYLPTSVKDAKIIIYDMQGKQLKSIPVTARGNASESIHSSELHVGIFLYTLLVDGKEVDTKRMIITE